MDGLALLLTFLGSAALSASAVWISIKLSSRWGFLDHPDLERKIQDRPIPKLGGVAVAFALTAAVTFTLSATGRQSELLLALAVLAPALGASVVGFFDDRDHLNPYLRLLLQAVLALLAWTLGTRIDLLGVAWLDAAVMAFWVMLIVNGFNLLDNSDGLAGATVLVTSAGSAFIALVFGQTLVAVMAVSLMGVAAGFLWHNWYPAKVYLGDSGAYFLGFMVALLVIRLRPSTVTQTQGVLIALLLLALPLLDTSFVVVKRLRAGVHPFTAGRDHLSHVLQGRGFSVPWSVAALQGVLVVSVVAASVFAVAVQ